MKKKTIKWNSVKFQDKCWFGLAPKSKGVDTPTKSTRITLKICAYRTEMPHFIHIWAIKSIVNHFVMSIFLYIRMKAKVSNITIFFPFFCIPLLKITRKTKTINNKTIFFRQALESFPKFFRVAANEHLSHFNLIYGFCIFEKRRKKMVFLARLP